MSIEKCASRVSLQAREVRQGLTLAPALPSRRRRAEAARERPQAHGDAPLAVLVPDAADPHDAVVLLAALDVVIEARPPQTLQHTRKVSTRRRGLHPPAASHLRNLLHSPLFSAALSLPLSSPVTARLPAPPSSPEAPSLYNNHPHSALLLLVRPGRSFADAVDRPARPQLVHATAASFPVRPVPSLALDLGAAPLADPAPQIPPPRTPPRPHPCQTTPRSSTFLVRLFCLPSAPRGSGADLRSLRPSLSCTLPRVSVRPARDAQAAAGHLRPGPPSPPFPLLPPSPHGCTPPSTRRPLPHRRCLFLLSLAGRPAGRKCGACMASERVTKGRGGRGEI